MMNCKMKQLALAVGVALGGLSLLPEAQAVSVSSDNLGQALIFPYYTVRGGWNTLFGVTNTSNQVVAVKVRFREAYNSRDVFDFNIILSPYDVWTGWVSDSTNGPVIRTEDNSCTVGDIKGTGTTGVTFPSYGGKPPAFTDSSGFDATDGGPETIDRMREGHIEMIMMGAAPVTDLVPGAPDPFPLARNAIHTAANAGNPLSCATLVAAFQDPTKLGSYSTLCPSSAPLPGVSGTLRGEFCNYAFYPAWVNGELEPVPLNPLKGTYALVNGAQGYNAVGTPVALENFRTTGVMTLQLPPSGDVAFSDSWHEPSLNAADTIGWLCNSVGNSIYCLGDGDGAEGVSFALLHTHVINEWSRRSNPAAGWVTTTDWVITFPTKNFFVDNDSTNEYAGRYSQRTNLPYLQLSTPFPFANFFTNVNSTGEVIRNGSSCDPISFTLRNREEQASTGAGFSPGANPQLCYETNVLTFNQGLLLNSPIASSINYPESFTFGWLSIGLFSDSSVRLMQDGSAHFNFGLPAVGFAITSRSDSTAALLSEAALYDHSYVRPELFYIDGGNGELGSQTLQFSKPAP